MNFVAITGSFASGKSFVSSYIIEKKHRVFSCDDFVKDLYLDKGVQKHVANILEIPFFDKNIILEKIYSDDIKRRALEDYIHPKVRKSIMKFKNDHQQEDILFVEIPLLFEGGFDNYFDFSICVYCDEKIRLKRAEKRSNFSLDIYKKITKIQFPYQKKISLSDFQINTGISVLETKKQIDKIIDNLL